MTRAYRYPLHPTTAQAATLARWLGTACDLYNAAVQERRDAWRVARKSVSYLDQQNQLPGLRAAEPAIADLPADFGKFTLRRVDLAFAAFFRRSKAGGAPGYPRFRPRRRYDSMAFRPWSQPAGNRVRVPLLGLVRFHRYRPIDGTVKHVAVGRERGGRWFVSFVCELGDAPPKAPVRSAAGIDLGLTSFATLSDGTDVANPRWFRAGQAQLRRRQQTLARRQRGSASRERARIQVARAHAHVANQRKDFGRKLACSLFQRFDLIAHEDLEIRRMVGGSFAKSIGDAGWGLFLRALHDKAEKAGRHAIAVDPRGTTQRCSGCGATVKKTIAERTHACSDCGLTLGRDHNAAVNVLALGRSAVEAGSSAVEAEGHNRPLPGTGEVWPSWRPRPTEGGKR